MSSDHTSRFQCTRQAALCALIAAFMLVSAGCELLLIGGAAGAGVGASRYYLGKLEKTVPHDVTTTHGAAVKALRGLDLTITQNRSDRVSAHLESEFADGKPVWIDMESAGEVGTAVTIRVGWMGDRARAERILEEMQKHLDDGQSSTLPGMRAPPNQAG